MKRDHALNKIINEVRERKFPYETKQETPIDWAAYTQAQIEEVNDTLILIRETVDAVPEPEAPRSQKGRTVEYAARDLAKTLLLQQYFQSSNRVTQGYARLFREKLNLDRVPHYKAIERAYEDARVRRVLDDVFDLTQRPEQGHVQGLTLDGSGLPRSVKANWESQKQTPQAKREHYDGSVTMLTVPHLMIAAHVPLAVGFDNECPTLKPLLEATVKRHGALNGAIVTGDAAFLSRDNCTLIEDYGGVPRIFPKRGVTLAPQGHRAWTRMLTTFLENPQGWLRDYHARSTSECGWNRDKHRNPRPLRRRLHRRRGTEKHLRFTTNNLTRLAYLRRLGEVKVSWVDRWAA